MSLTETATNYTTNCEDAMTQQEHEDAISNEVGEIIRLNNDLITINQYQIKKIVKEVLMCDDVESIRQQYYELCVQYKDIWIKVILQKSILNI